MQLAMQFTQKMHYKLRTWIKVQEVNNLVYKQYDIKQPKGTYLHKKCVY